MCRGKKIVKDTQPAQRLSRDAGMLSDNEIDSDIRFFNRPKHPVGVASHVSHYKRRPSPLWSCAMVLREA